MGSTLEEEKYFNRPKRSAKHKLLDKILCNMLDQPVKVQLLEVKLETSRNPKRWVQLPQLFGSATVLKYIYHYCLLKSKHINGHTNIKKLLSRKSHKHIFNSEVSGVAWEG